MASCPGRTGLAAPPAEAEPSWDHPYKTGMENWQIALGVFYRLQDVYSLFLSVLGRIKGVMSYTMTLFVSWLPYILGRINRAANLYSLHESHNSVMGTDLISFKNYWLSQCFKLESLKPTAAINNHR